MAIETLPVITRGVGTDVLGRLEPIRSLSSRRLRELSGLCKE